MHIISISSVVHAHMSDVVTQWHKHLQTIHALHNFKYRIKAALFYSVKQSTSVFLGSYNKALILNIFPRALVIGTTSGAHVVRCLHSCSMHVRCSTLDYHFSRAPVQASSTSIKSILLRIEPRKRSTSKNYFSTLQLQSAALL